jgi:ribosomal silencing factor RsfS
VKSEVLKDEIVSLLESKKAEDIVTIDLRKKVDFADFFVICSTHSTRHAQGLADLVMLELVRIQMIRSEHKAKMLSNKLLIAAVLASMALQAAAIYTPLNRIFGLAVLTWADWVYIGVLTACVYVAGTGVNALRKKLAGRSLLME